MALCREIVDQPVINVEDPVGKTVGRRRLTNAAACSMELQQLVNHVRQTQGYGGICRRGVYRFRSHEEADRWLTTQIVQRAIEARS